MVVQIVSRAEWGAEAVRLDRFERASYPMRELWLHHSYTVASADPRADARHIQRVAFGRGFADTSYTFLVHPDGTALEGRDIRAVGAHTWGRNERSLAICLIGNYHPGEPLAALEVTPAQIVTVRGLCERLVHGGFLVPGTYPTGGHRDNPSDPGASACPGDNAYRRLPEFRGAVDLKPEPASRPTIPGGRKLERFYAIARTVGQHEGRPTLDVPGPVAHGHHEDRGNPGAGARYWSHLCVVGQVPGATVRVRVWLPGGPQGEAHVLGWGDKLSLEIPKWGPRASVVVDEVRAEGSDVAHLVAEAGSVLVWNEVRPGIDFDTLK